MELLQRLDVVVLVVLWITVRRRECAPLQEGETPASWADTPETLLYR